MEKDKNYDDIILIIIFMGFTKKMDSNRYKIPSEPGYGKLSDVMFVNSSEFHTSWDWLMQVIKNIKEIWDNEIKKDTGHGVYYVEIFNCLDEINIDATFNAVVKFIKFYNKISNI